MAQIGYCMAAGFTSSLVAANTWESGREPEDEFWRGGCISPDDECGQIVSYTSTAASAVSLLSPLVSGTNFEKSRRRRRHKSPCPHKLFTAFPFHSNSTAVCSIRQLFPEHLTNSRSDPPNAAKSCSGQSAFLMRSTRSTRTSSPVAVVSSWWKSAHDHLRCTSKLGWGIRPHVLTLKAGSGRY